MGCKEDCLSLENNLKCMKHRGTELYSIVIGVQGSYKAFSGMFDTPTMAWKDCHNRMVK